MAARLLEMADDELILAHRDSEWTGHAPILEEDIAFANIAQDEMGHALIWYDIRRSLTGEDPDQLVFFREPSEFRNMQMVELPKGDWAFSMVRQFLFDTWETVHIEALEQTRFTPVVEAATKIRKEETYHLRHTRAWIRRLGLGTEESNRRMQEALDVLWPYHGQILVYPADYERLVDESLMPDLAPLSALWIERVQAELSDANLRLPGSAPVSYTRDHHSPSFPALIEELQQVARIEAEARW
ncbi:MAG: phenylacetate-CoA oxygenase subunit PaaI [Acidobacteria bacterium]|nr:MAG: phenylacetate-CoA oxygenase subunit PaaI [Acidobacteriota bacterium]